MPGLSVGKRQGLLSAALSPARFAPAAAARSRRRRVGLQFKGPTMSSFAMFSSRPGSTQGRPCQAALATCRQRGFGALSVLVWSMVIAVCLIAFMTNSRLSSPLGQSKSRLQASALIEQAAALAIAFTMADNEASLSGQVASFDDGPFGMLNIALTGTTLPVPPAEALESASFWRLQRNLLFGHGTAAADVALQLPQVSAQVCAEINQLVLGSSVVPVLGKTVSEVIGPAEGAGVAQARTHLAGTDVAALLLAAFPSGAPARACLKLSDGHLFFMVAKTL